MDDLANGRALRALVLEEMAIACVERARRLAELRYTKGDPRSVWLQAADLARSMAQDGGEQAMRQQYRYEAGVCPHCGGSNPCGCAQ